MKLQAKLMLTMATTAVLAVLASLIISVSVGTRSVEKEVEEKLWAVLDDRHASLADYLARVRRDSHILVSDPNTGEMLREFTRGFLERGESAQSQLQQLFIADNTRRSGDRQQLVDAGDDSIYARVHARFHPQLREMAVTRAWDDLLLVDPSGNVVYSTKKESDFATNVISG
ncbi:MAG TPA: hypothetical protein VFY12_01630, partial [Arenimonas sp.]|nr:hypothetical protein [Arenimonas sp.]